MQVGLVHGVRRLAQAVTSQAMDRHIWELHAAVFELARARGLRQFEVHYADTGDEIEIDLAMPPANDALPSPGEPASEHTEKQC
jgi:hypothetical protein